MQIKNTVRHHFTHIRKYHKTENKFCGGCGEIGTLTHCWWESKVVQSHGKQYGSSSKT